MTERSRQIMMKISSFEEDKRKTLGTWMIINGITERTIILAVYDVSASVIMPQPMTGKT